MVARGLLRHEQDFLDSLGVMEEGMRHFYVRAMAAKQTKQPDEVIDAAMIQAVQIAEKIAPYRHARLSALNLAGNPNTVSPWDGATAEELRAELEHRLNVLQEAGIIELQVIGAPEAQ